MLNKEDFQDDAKDAGEMGAGHTVTALYEIIPAGVETDLLPEPGELKYQEVKTTVKSEFAGELCNVKLRYKKPDADKSTEIVKAARDAQNQLGQTSPDYRWAAAVAEFAMLLRDSEFKGQATYDHCRRLAEAAKGLDRQGYRQEMIRLIDKAQALAAPVSAGK
jgi:Ca-activated chloride channel homolog